MLLFKKLKERKFRQKQIEFEFRLNSLESLKRSIEHAREIGVTDFYIELTRPSNVNAIWTARTVYYHAGVKNIKEKEIEKCIKKWLKEEKYKKIKTFKDPYVIYIRLK